MHSDAPVSAFLHFQVAPQPEGIPISSTKPLVMRIIRRIYETWGMASSHSNLQVLLLCGRLCYHPLRHRIPTYRSWNGPITHSAPRSNDHGEREAWLRALHLANVLLHDHFGEPLGRVCSCQVARPQSNLSRSSQGELHLNFFFFKETFHPGCIGLDGW